jgi:wyosine [tRNA(Phe)-imidazoG37] synthetase (radical SAM superfamily)
MNEKIKELAEQAEEYANQFVYVQAIGFPGHKEKFNEKFAELIVQECQVALSLMLRDMISRGHAYDLIKEHFGIKE